MESPVDILVVSVKESNCSVEKIFFDLGSFHVRVEFDENETPIQVTLSFLAVKIPE